MPVAKPSVSSASSVFSSVSLQFYVVVQQQDIQRWHGSHPPVDGIRGAFVGRKLDADCVERKPIRKNAVGLRFVFDNNDLPPFGGQRLSLDGVNAAR